MDKNIRGYVKKWLNMPKDIPISYIHANCKVVASPIPIDLLALERKSLPHPISHRLQLLLWHAEEVANGANRSVSALFEWGRHRTAYILMMCALLGGALTLPELEAGENVPRNAKESWKLGQSSRVCQGHPVGEKGEGLSVAYSSPTPWQGKSSGQLPSLRVVNWSYTWKGSVSLGHLSARGFKVYLNSQ